MKRVTFSLLIFFLTGWTVLADIERTDTKESLRGLKGIYVVVQMIDAQPQDLTTNDIEATVKDALRAGGVPMDAAPKKFNGDANLSVTVDALRQPQLNVYTFTVEVAVTQDALLTRTAGLKWVGVETWRRTIQGITTPDRMDVIQQGLRQCLKAFVDDYQAVNPPAN